MERGDTSRTAPRLPPWRRPERLVPAILLLAALAALLRFDGVRPSQASKAVYTAHERPPATTVAAAWNGEAACLSALTADPAARAARELSRLAPVYPPASDEVAGYRLVDQPRAGLNAFRALMARNPEAVRGPAADPRCRDVICAASAAFGPDLGPIMLLLAIDYHALVVLPARAGGPRWTPSDLRTVLAAADDLPPNQFPLHEEEYRSFVMMDAKALPPVAGRPAMALSGEAASAVTLSTLWRAARPSEQRAAIVHEFAHDFTRARGVFLDWRRLWAEAQAEDAKAALARGLPPEPVSAYAAVNLDEDFAESVTAYRYMPEVLRQGRPRRYALLRQWVFDELEYGDPAKCAPRRARSRRAETLALIGLYATTRTSQELADAALVCAGRRDPRLCSARFFYMRAYRKAWLSMPAEEPLAAMAALEGQLSETDLVNGAIARLPPNLVATMAAESR